MNLDEINALKADRKTDMLVAKNVMGWKYDDAPPGYASGWEKPDGYAGIEWSPSTNIAAAWEVVKEIRMPFCLTESAIKDGWSAEFLKEDGESTIVAHAASAPLAICRAALLAVQE